MSFRARAHKQEKQDKIDKADRFNAQMFRVAESAVGLVRPKSIDETAIDVQSREYQRASANQRRTFITLAGGSFTPDQWESLCAQYRYCCVCCGSDDPLTADHIKPVSLMGSSDISNIQPLCRSCNSRKGTNEIDYRNKS